MLDKLKSLFESRCPTCHELLTCDNTNVHLIKTCSQGHYKEETYHSLGVKIVYDATSNLD
ncbi:hypothetical protein PMSD_10450 [Paenibacillus macquariensis subsp. defensor]|nr:hypothetical protein PMSD_10450 [Paenibacillus macquariensis subsp. defensor]